MTRALPELASNVYRVLCERFDEGETLPRLAVFAARFDSLISPVPWRHCTQYAVWAALQRLHDDGYIAWQHGTRSENRGHQAIRILATGNVLKTANCPFDPPA